MVPLENVTHFLNALNDHHRPRALEELDYLGSCMEKSENISSPFSASLSSQSSLTNRPIQAWDKDYISTVLGSGPLTIPNSPSPNLRNITLGTTFQSLSTLFSSLFGLRFRLVEHSAGETWHEDVRKLEVYNEEKNEVVGWIFADLFGREGKASGAAHYTVRCSRRLDWDDWMGDRRYYEDGDEGVLAGEGMEMEGTKVSGREGVYQLPLAVLSCDFARPSVSGGASMLSYNEVETLYHEMGHALHCMSSFICFFFTKRHPIANLLGVQNSYARSDRLPQRLWDSLRHRFCRIPVHPHGTSPFISLRSIPHTPPWLQTIYFLFPLPHTRSTYCTQHRRPLPNPSIHAGPILSLIERFISRFLQYKGA